MLGAVGLGIDIGRMYIVKGEAQAFVDSSALAAASKLDETQTGINKANAAVAGNAGKWNFSSNTFDNVTVTYATDPNGTYTATPPDPPTGYNYVKVVATVDLPMYLIRVLAGSSANIAASAIAGRSQLSTLRWGLFPFSPYVRKGTYTDSKGNTITLEPDDPNDPFGFQIGGEYTLLWGAPGDKTTCKNDVDKPTLAMNGDVRGYCCVANTAATLRQAIVNGLTDSITVGQYVSMDSGQKNATPESIGWRVDQDSDTTSMSLDTYAGNGARLVVVPVNSGWPNYQLVGFAGFLLESSATYNGLHGNESACGIYVGAWTQGVNTPPDEDSPARGAWVIKLFQ